MHFLFHHRHPSQFVWDTVRMEFGTVPGEHRSVFFCTVVLFGGRATTVQRVLTTQRRPPCTPTDVHDGTPCFFSFGVFAVLLHFFLVCVHFLFRLLYGYTITTVPNVQGKAGNPLPFLPSTFSLFVDALPTLCSTHIRELSCYSTTHPSILALVHPFKEQRYGSRRRPNESLPRSRFQRPDV